MDAQEIKRLQKEIEEILHISEPTSHYILSEREVIEVLRSMYKLLKEVV